VVRHFLPRTAPWRPFRRTKRSTVQRVVLDDDPEGVEHGEAALRRAIEEQREIDFTKSMLDFIKSLAYVAHVNCMKVEHAMTNDWHELTDLTGDRSFLVTEVRLNTGIALRGEFELPPLARLRYEDQVFVSEFVRSHGSIKDMEKAFGISYPTVKNRLNRIIDQLQLVEVGTASARDDTLDLLERGEITADAAAERLRR
jgi:hypothetical protein